MLLCNDIFAISFVYGLLAMCVGFIFMGVKYYRIGCYCFGYVRMHTVRHRVYIGNDC